VVLAQELKPVTQMEFVSKFVKPIVLEETVVQMDVGEVVVLAQELTLVSMEFVLAHPTVLEEIVVQMDVEELVVLVRPEKLVILVVCVLLFVVMVLVMLLPRQSPTVLKIVKFVEMVFVMEMKIAQVVQ